MKYFILLFTGICFSQQNSLPSQAAKLYDAIYNMHIEGILQMSCVPNDASNYDKLDKAFQNEEYKLRYSLTNAKYTVSEPKIIDGKTWHLISYRNVLRITYFTKLTADEISKNNQSLKAKFKAQSVTYEKHRNSFLIVYPAKFLSYKIGEETKIFVADDTLLTDMFSDCITPDVKKEFNLN